MTKVLHLFAGLLPASRLKNALLRGLGHRVHPTARIRPTVLLGGTVLDIGPEVEIGALNAIRGVQPFRMGVAAELGQLNWITAARFLVVESESPLAGSFTIGDRGSVTNRHYLDASGGIAVGEYATVAGVRSTFMTHGIVVEDAVMDTKPIVVGEYAMMGGNCTVLLGATVPDRSVVAMGSVVLRGLTETEGLYAGVPARFRKSIAGSAYAKRTIGPIPPRKKRPV